jgi:hypothetical protein
MLKSCYSRDRDFYCSFTELPNVPQVNLDELPFTIHSPRSMSRLSSSANMRHNQQQQQQPESRRRSSRFPPLPNLHYPRPRSNVNSFDSNSSSTSFRTFISASSSSASSLSNRGKQLFAKVRQPFESIFNYSKPGKTTATGTSTTQLLLQSSRKPSTLDFRCIGTSDVDDILRRVSIDLLTQQSSFATPIYDGAPHNHQNNSTGSSSHRRLWNEPLDSPKIDWSEPRINDDGFNWFSDIY